MLILVSILILDIEFDLIGAETFSLPNGEFSKNVIIFSADMSSSAHDSDKKGSFNSW